MMTLKSIVTVTDSDGFAKARMTGLVSVEIVSSWENILDTAKIIIPKRVVWIRDGLIYERNTDPNKPIFKRGDGIVVELGYEEESVTDQNKITERFRGTITKVTTKIPIEITAEDDVFKLKTLTTKKPVKVAEGSTEKLLKVLQEAFPAELSSVLEVEDITIGKFEIKGRVTLAELLDYFKRNYGFSVWIRDGKIHVGLAYQLKSIESFTGVKLPVFNFQSNVVEDKLDFIHADDILYRVEATNIKKDNTRKMFPFGDPAGELRTFMFYDMPEASIEKLATDMLNRYKFTGYRGSFTGFLNPRVRHGDVIKLKDAIIPDRNGAYVVKAVTTRSGTRGGRQEITLDRKVE